MSNTSTESNTINVTQSSETKEITVPFRPGQEELVKQEVEDYLQRFSEIVSKECGIDVEEIYKCMPKNIVFQEEKKKKTTSKKKDKKLNVTNWESASSMDDLKELKGNDLKDILKSNNMKSAGPKQKLIERVWSINHPQDVSVTPMKKRGRPKGTKKDKMKHSIVDDSDTESPNQPSKSESESTDDIEKMLQASVETTMSNGKVMHVVISKKWVFSVDSDGDYDWEGMLNDDGESFTDCDPPEDLLALYNDTD
tara:strand:- start:1071 stop:1829 length:759 start_codon:yes stop_codon:yes gene_type:complete